MLSAADNRHRSEGDDGSRTHDLLRLFLEELHAIMIRGNYDMLLRHTTDRT